jgi:hypothetical protein
MKIKKIKIKIYNKEYNVYETSCISPVHSFPIDRNYGGYWILADDINNDERVEIVSVKTKNIKDDIYGKAHFVSSVITYTINGEVIWKWGEASDDLPHIGYNVPCQIFDLNFDGKKEVIFCTSNELIVLEGATGNLLNKYTLPEKFISDSICFANSNSATKSCNIILKNRYQQVWVFDQNFKLLWTINKPFGSHPGHSVYNIDIDNDGKDELLFGYCLFNSLGQIEWNFKNRSLNDLSLGHIDSCKIVRKGKSPKEYRLIISTCKSKTLLMIDGLGNIIWEVNKEHFERIFVGYFYSDDNSLQIIVDIKNELTNTSNDLWIFNEYANKIGEINTISCHFYCVLNWGTEKTKRIALASHNLLLDYNNKTAIKIITKNNEQGYHVLSGNFLNEYTEDILLVTNKLNINIYKGTRFNRKQNLGTETNYSLF